MVKHKLHESLELHLTYCPDCTPAQGTLTANDHCYLTGRMTTSLCPVCRRPMLDSSVIVRAKNMDLLVRLLDGAELFNPAGTGGHT